LKYAWSKYTSNKLNSSIRTARNRTARSRPIALIEEAIDVDIQTLEEDHATIVQAPVVYLTSSPGTKRNTTSATNKVVGPAGIFQTSAIRPTIDFVAKAGTYRQEILP
jgi:hypothetical protein